MKKITIFNLVTLIFILTFSINSYAETEKEKVQKFTIDSKIFLKHTENKCIYKDEIVTISAFSSTNSIFETLNWLEIDNGTQIEYVILDNNNIPDKTIMDYYYEFDNDGNVCVISRDIKEFHIRKIKEKNGKTYSLENIPKWIDNVYTYYEIQSKIQEKAPEFLLNEVQEVVIEDTLYYVLYKDNKWHYFNTETLKNRQSDFIYAAEKLLETEKEINFGDKKMALYSYDNKFIVSDKNDMRKILYNLSALPLYNESEGNILEFIKENIKPFKDVFKNIEYHCKKYDIEQKVVKENKKDKEKIYKKIVFKKDKSFVELKDKKIRYCTIIDNVKYYYTIKNEKDLFKKEITRWVADAVTYADNVIGCEYSQEKRTENFKYYDCSSLVYYAYKNNDILLCDKDGYPPTAAEEAKWLEEKDKFKKIKEVEKKDLKIGDLIFYSYENNDRYLNISHVAMYIGNGKMIHAASKNKGVCKEDVKLKCVVGYATVK